MDCHHDPGSSILQAYIELPDARWEDVYVMLVDSSVSRGQSVNVWGFTLPPHSYTHGMHTSSSPASNPMVDVRSGLSSLVQQSLGFGLPPSYISRERRYGEFFRQLPVPPETKAADVQAVFDNSVLHLSIALGAPLTDERVNVSREIIDIQ
ncbi:hypothetical protein BDP27DRAFT_1422121 [Rhodocollybia butyracea]|uniref:SHSP domain-containing protein n=1 Tax=Rhodocollybia butyracea TaxID=206335 RepID=A0A9P5PTG2_9AGAR|nr:hypothetical protein BDP27DRAFT_1422121 [Rhodocollybia butyracea]